jgi:hypothetical protein
MQLTRIPGGIEGARLEIEGRDLEESYSIDLVRSGQGAGRWDEASEKLQRAFSHMSKQRQGIPRQINAALVSAPDMALSRDELKLRVVDPFDTNGSNFRAALKKMKDDGQIVIEGDIVRRV